MKRVIKNNMLGFIVGLSLGLIGIVSASVINARDVIYRDTNVESAINDIYTKTNNGINTFYFLTWSGSNDGFYYSNYQNYKYFRITETETGTSSSINITKLNWSNNGASTTLSLNTKYEITTDNEQIVIQPNTGYRNIKVEFFKN